MDVQINTLEYFYFSIGGYFEGYSEVVFDNNIFLNKKHPNCQIEMPQLSEMAQLSNDIDDIAKAKSLIKTLNKLYLLQWPHRFEDFGVLDGTNWSLEIKYNGNKRKKTIAGNNAFPEILKNDNKIVITSSSEYTKDFQKLLNTLNKIVETKNYFY